MIDVFYEETVSPSDSVKAGKKFKRMQLMSIMMLISALFFTFLLFISFYTPLESASFSAFVPIIFNFVMCVTFYVFFFMLRSRKHRYLVDYDYTFISGELRIAKVFNGLKRRPVAKIQTSDISVMGKISSENYLRYKTMPGIKTILATPNEETTNENIYFMVCMYKGFKSIIIFEPSPNLVYNIKRFAGRTVDYV